MSFDPNRKGTAPIIYPEDKDAPSWAHMIIQHITESVRARAWQRMARSHVQSPEPSMIPWEEKPWIDNQIVWRAARQALGEVPERISEDHLYKEDGSLKDGRRNDVKLLQSIKRTVHKQAQWAVDGFHGHFDREMKRDDLQVMIRVKRHSIEIVSVMPEGQRTFSK